jgi:hypothetical protein
MQIAEVPACEPFPKKYVDQGHFSQKAKIRQLPAVNSHLGEHILDKLVCRITSGLARP